MKPVIAHVIQHLKPGGIETLVIEMLKLKSQFDVHIIALEGTTDVAIEKFPQLWEYQNNIHCLNKSEGVQWQTAAALRTLLRQVGACSCISHHIGPLLYVSMAKIGLNLAHVHVEHDAWHLNDPKHERLQHWCLRMSQPSVVADAQCVADIIENKFDFVRPHVIHNGVDTDRFAPGSMLEARTKLQLPHGKRLIGCAARLEPVKRIEKLIDALLDLPEDVELVIAGEGSQRVPLMRHVQKLNLTSRVHFTGFLTELEYFYRALDLFCLVSSHEGFPLSVLEAQACGTPVVVNNVGGCRETVCHKTGLLLITDTQEQLSNSIKLQLLRTYKVSPREFIETNYSIQSMNSKYEYLIENVLLFPEVA